MRIVVALLAFVLAVTTQCATNNNQQLTSSSDHSTHTSEKTEPIPGADTDKFLGVVKNGEFQCLWPKLTTAVPFKLTTISMMAAMAPDAAKLDLSQYEGCAIMVQGHGDTEWIYDAHIIDNTGPIFTTVVRHVFSEASQTSEETEVTLEPLEPYADGFLGVVKNGKFHSFSPMGVFDDPLTLTNVGMVEARPPEAGILSLSRYEGCAIMVQGRGGGKWIYRARIVDNAGPIVTAIVQHIFKKE